MEIKWFIMIMKIHAILVQYTLYYLSLLFLIIIGISSSSIHIHGWLKRSNINAVTNINDNTEQ